MFFKRKKLPAMKEHLINKGQYVIEESENQFAVFYTKFIFIILNEKLFGQTKKEKIKLDNDISVFELLSYSFSRLYLYLEYNFPNRVVLPFHKAYDIDRKGLNSRPTHDLINVFEKVTESLLKDYLNWENTFEKMQNRIGFYLEHEPNIRYHHQVLESAIENSIKLKEPTNDILENWNPINGNIEKSLFFSTNIVEFEKAYLSLAFKETDIFFNQDKSVGFAKRNLKRKE
nr:hypothetical protein BACY1_04830 [Tenacibaculum mesophilum]